MLMFAPTEETQGRWESLTKEAQGRQIAAVQQWLRDNQASSFARLQPPATAKTIRFKDEGAPLITDGPFVEAKESIGGFALIDATDLDHAMRIAKTWPGGDIVEIRPVLEPQRP
ncbi:MAG: YciI family protein [Chloroflexota bacterium]